MKSNSRKAAAKVTGTAAVIGIIFSTLMVPAEAAPSPPTSFASYVCGEDVTIRSRSLTDASAATLCSRLNEVRAEYAEVILQGDPLVNASGNRTVGLDFYAFANNNDYVRFGNQLGFEPSDDADANNGVMFEYDATTPGNRAAVAINGHGGPVTEANNIEHEFVHYLDFRYNQSSEQVAPLWWSEGVAEVIGNPQDTAQARKITARRHWKLSGLLWNESTDSEDYTYRGGSAAVEFFLKTRPVEYAELMDVFRNGDTEDYEAWAEQIGDSLDGEFARWVRANSPLGKTGQPKVSAKPGSTGNNNYAPAAASEAAFSAAYFAVEASTAAMLLADNFSRCMAARTLASTVGWWWPWNFGATCLANNS